MARRKDGIIVLGTGGGSGGRAWSFEKAQAITKIKISVLKVSVPKVIVSITFDYMHGETARSSQRYGGDGGEIEEIELGPAESIISMKGYYDAYNGMTIIYSLTFVTTHRECGPYGTEQGTRFFVHRGSGWIDGFFGRSGTLLDAIGVYKKTPFECGVVKVGPWGELTQGSLKDTKGTPTQLTKIIIRFGERLQSIKFQYVADGVAKWSSTWGGESGDTAEIDLTNHYLIDISGHYGDYNNSTIIKSLTFVSTRGTHGPYGRENGTAFSLPVKDGKVVGFFGRSRGKLCALGFYLKPNSV